MNLGIDSQLTDNRSLDLPEQLAYLRFLVQQLTPARTLYQRASLKTYRTLLTTLASANTDEPATEPLAERAANGAR